MPWQALYCCYQAQAPKAALGDTDSLLLKQCQPPTRAMLATPDLLREEGCQQQYNDAKCSCDDDFVTCRSGSKQPF